MDKLPRPTTQEQRDDLKQMTRASLRKVKGAKFALVTRYEAAELSKFGSDHPDCADRFMPVDVLADLQLELPHGVAAPLLEALAHLGGFKLVPLDEGDDSGEGVCVERVGLVMKEGGEAKSAALRAVGSTCLDTVRTARRETAEAREAYAAMATALARQERHILRRAV